MIKKSANQIRLEYAIQVAVSEKVALLHKIKSLRRELIKDNKSKMSAKQLANLKKAWPARISSIENKKKLQ
jgi:mRNA-degrading endonuclease toxin of MazEF toxin-antitoxin module